MPFSAPAAGQLADAVSFFTGSAGT